MCDCGRRGWIPGQKPTRGRGEGATAVWGPLVWRVLHDLAEARADVGADLWIELGRVLPESLLCSDCKEHMSAWFMVNPLGDDGPRLWILAAHNAVNRRLGRRVWTESDLAGVYRGCDRMMMALELRQMVRELGESGLLGSGAIRVIERMVE